MKKMTTVILSASFLVSSALFAHGGSTQSNSNNTHMGDHMHNGKMSNHANSDGMTDAQMKKMANETHMGDHMHNGKMSNHANSDGMTDAQMKTSK